MSFGVLRNKLKKKLGKIRSSKRYGDYQTKKEEKLCEWFLALLVETEKTHLLIERKQLEDRLMELQTQYDHLMIPSKEGPIIRKQIDFLKELLELGEKK